MAQQTSTEVGCKVFKLWGQTVESVFGLIKTAVGWMYGVSPSGISVVQSEWLPICVCLIGVNYYYTGAVYRMFKS